jgi:hypothetical protein
MSVKKYSFQYHWFLPPPCNICSKARSLLITNSPSNSILIGQLNRPLALKSLELGHFFLQIITQKLMQNTNTPFKGWARILAHLYLIVASKKSEVSLFVARSVWAVLGREQFILCPNPETRNFLMYRQPAEYICLLDYLPVREDAQPVQLGSWRIHAQYPQYTVKDRPSLTIVYSYN